MNNLHQEVLCLVKKLQQLHEKHLTRPDFDENSSEEKEIESLTKDITAVSFLSHLLSIHRSFSRSKDVKWMSFIRSTNLRLCK